MKRVTLALLLLFSITTIAQQGINYKAVIKDGAGVVLSNTPIPEVRFIILDGGGSAVYEETHTPTTDTNGIVILNIGEGTPVSGDFSALDWSSTNHELNVKIDTGGGLQDMGETPFKMVPYAMHAQTASNGQSSGTMAGEMQYWDGSDWVLVDTSINERATLQLIGGIPTWVGGTPPLGMTDVYNPITNEVWMDRNLGASRVATSSTDAASYGDLYQWGRGADGHQLRTSSTTATLSSADMPGHGDFILPPNSPYDWRNPQNGTLWQGVTGINNPCPTGYRLPTEIEWDAERLSWSSNNAAGAFASPLKLPVAGLRSITGLLFDVGSNGIYWSSAVSSFYSRRLEFYSGGAGTSRNLRALGFSVRCIKY